jgi:C-terminal processing protease CtpA/Prc
MQNGSLALLKTHVYSSMLFTCIMFVTITANAQDQWNSFSYEVEKAHKQSLLPVNVSYTEAYTFFGTSFDLTDNVITKGYEPFRQNDSWKTHLNAPITLTNWCLYYNLYSVNVSAFRVHVCVNDTVCYEKNFSFSKDGYQVPFETTIDGYSTKPCKSGKHNMVTASIIKRDSSKPMQLVVGDATSYEKTFVKKPSQGHFFYEVTGKKENQLPDYVRTKFGTAYPIKQNTDYISFNGADYNFTTEAKDEQTATLHLIRHVFGKYPFYQEHRLNKQAILDSVNDIVNSSQPFDSKISLLVKKAKDLHDAHFYFASENRIKTNVSAPLILKRIDEDVQVVGIRDDRLNNKIALGDRIYAINTSKCDRFTDSLSNEYYGDVDERRELAISHLIEQPINTQPYKLTLQKQDGKLYEVEVTFDKKYPVPDRFKPAEHFGFQPLQNNWVYLKVNKWDKGDWIKFYNLKDSLRTAKGIVFDLRGNPGGYESEPIQITSCFIKKPFVYSVQTYEMNGQTYSGNSIMEPNKFLDLSKLEVIILIDNKTSCASEAFATMMKKVKNATIIGTSRSGGTFSTIYPLHFPGNITLNANVFGKTYFLEERKTIEYTGVKPDIVVTISKYTDLYAYEDKVLKIAQKIIN